MGDISGCPLKFNLCINTTRVVTKEYVSMLKKACLNPLLQRKPFSVGKWLSLHLAILGNLYFDFNSLRAFLIGGDLIDQALFVGIADDVYPMCAGIVQQRPVDWFGVLKAA